MTHLTDKRETLLGAVGISGMSTHRACLARVVGVYLDGHRAMQEGFIGKHAVQLGKAPFGIRGVGTPLLLTRLFASLAFGSLTNVRQVFQADQAVGVSVNDAFVMNAWGKEHNAGGKVGVHEGAQQYILYVIRGAGELTLIGKGGEVVAQVAYKPDDVIVFQPHTLHGWVNGSEPFDFLGVDLPVLRK